MKIIAEIDKREENPILEIVYTEEEKENRADIVEKTTSILCQIIADTLDNLYPNDLEKCKHLADYFIKQSESVINGCIDQVKDKIVENLPIGDMLEDMVTEWLEDAGYEDMEEFIDEYSESEMNLDFYIKNDNVYICLSADGEYADILTSFDCSVIENEEEYNKNVLYAYVVAMLVLDFIYDEDNHPLRGGGDEAIERFGEKIKKSIQSKKGKI